MDDCYFCFIWPFIETYTRNPAYRSHLCKEPQPWTLPLLTPSLCAPKPKQSGLVPPVIKQTILHRLRCFEIFGSKVTVILLNGWILHIGGVASERVCVCAGNSIAKGVLKIALVPLLPKTKTVPEINNFEQNKNVKDFFYSLECYVFGQNKCITPQIYCIIREPFLFQFSCVFKIKYLKR